MAEKPTYELIKQQGKEGLKLLYERYGQKLYSYAIHSWKLNEDEAWELVYQALYKVCAEIDKYSFTDEKAFASFLFTLFINLLRNHLRDKKELPTESLEDIGDPASEASDDSDNRQMLQLKEELDKLEDWERVLLLLRSQDMPYAEIAKYTGKSPDTLKVYYGRLKEKLSKRLNPETLKQELK